MNRRTVIIGGGFYGCCLALFFRDAGDEVVLIEASDELLTRASYNNQARIHAGYHYPRSILTGKSCVVNFPRFVADFASASVNNFTKIYAIARVNSKITAGQFVGYCQRIGTPVQEAPAAVRGLFNYDLIEEVFSVREYAFNAKALRDTVREQLQASGVEVRLGQAVTRVEPIESSAHLRVRLEGDDCCEADQVFSCTYAQMNSLLQRCSLPLLDVKHELAELALMEPPKELASLGITVMDGPFFSAMPFPAENLHSLSHVRYTPHEAWKDSSQFRDAYSALTLRELPNHYSQMIKDACRYLPIIQRSRYVRSLFEVKSLLGASEQNDGRPILLKRNVGFPGFHLVMGGKIDNIYDILQAVSDLRNPQEPATALTEEFFRKLFYASGTRK